MEQDRNRNDRSRVIWGDRHTEAVSRLVDARGGVVPMDRLCQRSRRNYRAPDAIKGDWLSSGSTATIVHQLRGMLGFDAIMTVFADGSPRIDGRNCRHRAIGYQASERLLIACARLPVPTTFEMWASMTQQWLQEPV